MLRGIYDEHTGLRDRFAGTGTVLPELAAWLGLVGLPARASGQPLDLRIDVPQPPYDTLDVHRCVQHDGDVLARVTLRFDELVESLRLVRQILRSLPTGAHAVPVSVPAAGSVGVGLVEGWRGPVVVGLEAGPDGIDQSLPSPGPVLAQLAGARARGHRQHRSRLPADQQVVQPVLQRT